MADRRVGSTNGLFSNSKKKNSPSLWTSASVRQPIEEGFSVLFLHIAVRSTGPDVVLGRIW
jgi:hypothetical protein